MLHRKDLSLTTDRMTPSPRRWSAQLLAGCFTLSVWAAVAYSAVGWWLQDDASTGAVSGIAPAQAWATEPDPQAVARALGAQVPVAVAAPSQASRLQLMGVLNGDPSTGVALMSIDGKTAKPYRVGTTVTDGLVLQSTQAKRVNLGPSVDGPTTVSLDLPAKK